MKHRKDRKDREVPEELKRIPSIYEIVKIKFKRTVCRFLFGCTVETNNESNYNESNSR